MKKLKKTEQALTDFDYHEVVHTCWIIQDLIENTLITHPVFAGSKNAAIKEKIRKAQMLIGEAYQKISNLY